MSFVFGKLHCYLIQMMLFLLHLAEKSEDAFLMAARSGTEENLFKAKLNLNYVENSTF